MFIKLQEFKNYTIKAKIVVPEYDPRLVGALGAAVLARRVKKSEFPNDFRTEELR